MQLLGLNGMHKFSFVRYCHIFSHTNLLRYLNWKTLQDWTKNIFDYLKFNINLKSPELHKQKTGSSFFIVPKDYKLNCFRYSIEDDGQKGISNSAKDKKFPPKKQNWSLTQELLN